MKTKLYSTTLGVIVGNRGFFSDHLCESGRAEVLRVLEEEGITAVTLSPADTKFGSVETLEDAKKCAALFKQYGDEMDGVLVTLPNFSDVQMSCQDIIAGTVGKENTYGTVVGRAKSGPFTYCRVSTDDTFGVIRAYLGEGEVTDDQLETFGGYGVVHVPDFQGLLKYICENGFEHHVAMNMSQSAAALDEALSKYMGWDVYHHGADSA